MQNGFHHLFVFNRNDGLGHSWALQYAGDEGPIAHFETEAEALACLAECHRVAAEVEDDEP